MGENATDCPSSPVVIDVVEVSEVMLVLEGNDVSIVFTTVVSLEVGAVAISDVVRGMMLIPKEDKVADVLSIEYVS